MLEILNDIRALGWDEIFLSAGIGFILITLNRPKKKAATTEKHSIFLDRSRFFAYEEIRSSMLKFEWIPIRKYLIEDKIEEISALDKLTDLVQGTKGPFCVLAGKAGSGKTKLLYEFARVQKKNTTYFADWTFSDLETKDVVDDFRQLPAAVKYIILDDADKDIRKAIKFCLHLLPAKEKFIISTRQPAELNKILKEYQQQEAPLFELPDMVNLRDLIEDTADTWLTEEIKSKLLIISGSNPDVFSAGYEFINNKIQSKAVFDTLNFLKEIKNAEELFSKIHEDFESQLGKQASELISRTVFLHGLDRSDPFSKQTFRSYIKLRSGNYFYVQNDRMFFKPNILGEYIARNHFFSNDEINPSFIQMLEDCDSNDLAKIIPTLIRFNKAHPSPVYKDAGSLVLSNIRNKSLNDTDIIWIVLGFYDEFRDPKIIFDSCDELLELKINATDPEIINRLAIFYAENKIYENAAKAWERLVEVARHKKLDGWLTVSYNNLGLVYQNLGDWENAIECYQLAHDRFEANGITSGLAQSLLNLAQVHQKKGDWKHAIEIYQKAVPEFERAEQPDVAANTLVTIAQIYKNHGETESAILNFQSARAIYKKTANLKGKIRVYGNLGLIYKNKNDYEAAAEYFEHALEASEKANDEKSIAYTYNNLALVHQQSKNIEKALEYYQKSIDGLTQIKDEKNLSLALSNLALIYQTKENWEKALEYHQRAKEIKEKIGDQGGVIESFDNIGNIFMANKKWADAEIYFTKSIQLSDKLKKEKNPDICGNLGVVYLQQDLFKKAEQMFALANTIYEKKGDIPEMAKIRANLGLVYFEQKKTKEAIEVLNEVLFYYLNKESIPDIKEVSGALTRLQKEMDEDQFNDIADKALNDIANKGILWGGQLVLAGNEVSQVLVKMKKKKKERVAKGRK